MNEKIKIIFVVGPTASGKTALGVNIAKAVNGEIISADSMQVYKDMHIASAAASKEEQCGIPHHLLEFLPYGEKFTVYGYVKAAREAAREIAARGKIPVTVGGTGLYVNSLIDNIEYCEENGSEEVRKRLEAEYDANGGEHMLAVLRSFDPDSAAALHPNDRRRIVRALEIAETTGLTKAQQKQISRQNESPFIPTVIGITYKDRQKLYDRINARVDIMMENGLLEEARAAYLRKESGTRGAVQAIGHKEFFSFFEGEITLDEAVENLKRQTRRYAKRQLTWFGARDDINWIYADSDNVLSSAKRILERQGYRFE